MMRPSFSSVRYERCCGRYEVRGPDRRHHRELQVYCYRMLRSFDAAEDHVQEVFLRAWRSRDAFEERSSARTWLYRIATNACLDTLRRLTRRCSRTRTSCSTSAPAPTRWPWPRDDPLWRSSPRSSCCRPPAGRAHPARRAVLVAERAAALLDTTVPAVHSALQRARATLRERWPGGRLGGRLPANQTRRSASCSSTSPPTNGPTRRPWSTCSVRTSG